MGKEGSRKRRRWNNDHLLHIPMVEPPLPSDWEVRPTYPVRTVPYYLCSLWDAGVKQAAEERRIAQHLQKKASANSRARATSTESHTGRVPQDLKAKLKKSKGAKTLLQDLEEEVRKFIHEYENKSRKLSDHNASDAEFDSEDEEIVFIGRNGTMSDRQRKAAEQELQREKLVWESFGGVNDKRGGFGRWLIHSLAEYYGLSSRSATVGKPPNERREAYIGIKELGTYQATEIPRPLYCLI